METFNHVMGGWRRAGKILAVVAGIFAGCSAAPSLEPSVYYTPPGDPDGRAGFIKGSEMFVLLGYKPVVFPSAIGDKRVKGGAGAWQQRLPVEPGPVDIDVGFAQGEIRRTVHLRFDAEAGEIYEIQFSGDPPGGIPVKMCDIWIASLSTGNAVTPFTRLSLAP